MQDISQKWQSHDQRWRDDAENKKQSENTGNTQASANFSLISSARAEEKPEHSKEREKI